jgi:hypothetical protein
VIPEHMPVTEIIALASNFVYRYQSALKLFLGNIPSCIDLKNLCPLQTINYLGILMENNIRPVPESIADLPKLSKELVLSGNKFYGRLPLE